MLDLVLFLQRLAGDDPQAANRVFTKFLSVGAQPLGRLEGPRGSCRRGGAARLARVPRAVRESATRAWRVEGRGRVDGVEVDGTPSPTSHRCLQEQAKKFELVIPTRFQDSCHMINKIF